MKKANWSVSFPFSFSNLQTKNELFFVFKSEVRKRMFFVFKSEVRKKNELVFSLANLKTKKEKTVYTRTQNSIETT